MLGIAMVSSFSVNTAWAQSDSLSLNDRAAGLTGNPVSLAARVVQIFRLFHPDEVWHLCRMRTGALARATTPAGWQHAIQQSLREIANRALLEDRV
jgi:hypothetical protein